MFTAYNPDEIRDRAQAAFIGMAIGDALGATVEFMTASEIAAKYAKQFPKIELTNITALGGWTVAQKKHFADNGLFDQIITANNASPNK